MGLQKEFDFAVWKLSEAKILMMSPRSALEVKDDEDMNIITD